MAPSLKFSRVAGVPGTYEVRRGCVLLGCVSEVEVIEQWRSPTTARIRKVRRWQFQRLGGDVHRLQYATRAAAARALVTVFDAFTSRSEGW